MAVEPGWKETSATLEIVSKTGLYANLLVNAVRITRCKDMNLKGWEQEISRSVMYLIKRRPYQKPRC